MPGELIPVKECKAHDADGPQLDAWAKEFAAQLSVPRDLPLAPLTVGGHDSWMMDHLREQNMVQTRTPDAHKGLSRGDWELEPFQR